MAKTNVLRYFDCRLQAKTLLFKQRPGSQVVCPDVRTHPGKTGCFRLLHRPVHKLLPYALPAILWTNSNSVNQEALPTLPLINWSQDPHPIRGKIALLLLPQPGGGVGV